LHDVYFYSAKVSSKNEGIGIWITGLLTNITDEGAWAKIDPNRFVIL